MRLKAPSAAASVKAKPFCAGGAASAGASACAALSTVDTALMDGAVGNVWACAIDRDYPRYCKRDDAVAGGGDKGSACRGRGAISVQVDFCSHVMKC